MQRNRQPSDRGIANGFVESARRPRQSVCALNYKQYDARRKVRGARHQRVEHFSLRMLLVQLNDRISEQRDVRAEPHAFSGSLINLGSDISANLRQQLVAFRHGRRRVCPLQQLRERLVDLPLQAADVLFQHTHTRPHKFFDSLPQPNLTLLFHLSPPMFKSRRSSARGLNGFNSQAPIIPHALALVNKSIKRVARPLRSRRKHLPFDAVAAA